MDEYRKLRDQAGATVDDQLSLARWCDKAGLKEQQRAHLMFALQLKPNCKEAIAKLGLVHFSGRLVPATELDDIKNRLKQSLVESREMQDRVGKWQLQLREHPHDQSILNQVRAVRDPAAIPVLSKRLGYSGQDACSAVVDALAAMPQQAATDALIRVALYSSYDPVSRNAAYALRSRSLFGYAPLLIAQLQAPIKMEYDVLNFDPSNFTHQLRLSREYADHKDVRIDYASSTNTSPLISVGQGSMTTPAPADTSGMRTMAAAAQQQQRVRTVVNKVQQINDDTAVSNAALIGLLKDTTGQQLSNNPTDWWEWWYDYNGYYRPEEQPVNYTGVLRTIIPAIQGINILIIRRRPAAANASLPAQRCGPSAAACQSKK